jgi:hypothetical protein
MNGALPSRALRPGIFALCLFAAFPQVQAAESAARSIEEVIVTAERKESTVQDTAISITAFTGEFIEDFGLRNQEDLQNYIPAAVIEPYDMAIRGIGRTYRGLGGDPGVATYLNDVYSEDFGIASTEGGLFDIERRGSSRHGFRAAVPRRGGGRCADPGRGSGAGARGGDPGGLRRAGADRGAAARIGAGAGAALPAAGRRDAAEGGGAADPR